MKLAHKNILSSELTELTEVKLLLNNLTFAHSTIFDFFK